MLSSQQDCILLARALSEAFCPNIQPRAHARLTGLTMNHGARIEISGMSYEEKIIGRRYSSPEGFQG